MSKRNFFALLLFTACFVWTTANIAEAAKPFCGDGICKNKENPCNCEDDCGPPPTIEENCSDGIDNNCDNFIQTGRVSLVHSFSHGIIKIFYVIFCLR